MRNSPGRLKVQREWSDSFTLFNWWGNEGSPPSAVHNNTVSIPLKYQSLLMSDVILRRHMPGMTTRCSCFYGTKRINIFILFTYIKSVALYYRIVVLWLFSLIWSICNFSSLCTYSLGLMGMLFNRYFIFFEELMFCWETATVACRSIQFLSYPSWTTLSKPSDSAHIFERSLLLSVPLPVFLHTGCWLD